MVIFRTAIREREVAVVEQRQAAAQLEIDLLHEYKQYPIGYSFSSLLGTDFL
jgi:hypothetical protein